jgi:hypothetical protein
MARMGSGVDETSLVRSDRTPAGGACSAEPHLRRLLWGSLSRHTSPFPPSRVCSRQRPSAPSLGTTVKVTSSALTMLGTERQIASCGPRSSNTPGSFATRLRSKPSSGLSALSKTETILLSGHLRAMASFGSPKGHSLSVVTSARAGVTARSPSSIASMDALPRIRLGSGACRE